MGLIDKVCDFRRVINKLSRMFDGLQVEARKLKEGASSATVAAAEARVTEVTQQLEELKS